MSTSILGTHTQEGETQIAEHDDSHEHHVQSGHTPSPPHAHTHSVHAAHSGHDPHAHPVHHGKVKRKSRTWLWLGLGTGIALVLMAGGVWWLQVDENPPPVVHTSAELMAQMRATSQGWDGSANVFGGKLKSEEVNGHHVVTVSDIPNKPCVESGWALAREGQVTVNGVFLPRISAGKLAELCSSGNNQSTIVWVQR